MELVKIKEFALMEIAGAALGRLGANRVEGFPLANKHCFFSKPKGLSFSTTHLDLVTSPCRRMSIHYSHSLFPFAIGLMHYSHSQFPLLILT